MTREEAIEIIRRAFDSWESEYRCSREEDWSEEYEARDMAIKALEQEQKQKWIPVSARLPEDGKHVLVTYKSEYSTKPIVDKAAYSHNLYEFDNFDFAGKKRAGWYYYDSEYGYLERNDVIAWMPKPKPYKAESEEV